MTAPRHVEDIMRLGSILPLAAALAAACAATGCGGDPAGGDAAKPAARTLEGDAALIAAAQAISDAVGGCVKPADAALESKVVGLENGAIVMLGCSQHEFASTSRLFAVRGSNSPVLLSIPDYDANGWVARDQASMSELDAGTGVLTTMRKGASNGGCGSEGTYRWDGEHFVLQELRWQACDSPDAKGPPFPVMWPTQQGAAVDPNGATPAP
jgi:hypothetical protein